MDVLYILKVEKLFGWRKRPLTACQPERLFSIFLCHQPETPFPWPRETGS
ncbi:hypothetical protein ASZ90_013702 [hydrocarbon metagenome]|uniref:Uncharacterized protein n=1 Tax=hydrocarbon metagenome TaxID=938273 RepID=A0A0W8F6Z1_9ZZZZ